MAYIHFLEIIKKKRIQEVISCRVGHFGEYTFLFMRAYMKQSFNRELVTTEKKKYRSEKERKRKRYTEKKREKKKVRESERRQASCSSH